MLRELVMLFYALCLYQKQNRVCMLHIRIHFKDIRGRIKILPITTLYRY